MLQRIRAIEPILVFDTDRGCIAAYASNCSKQAIALKLLPLLDFEWMAICHLLRRTIGAGLRLCTQDSRTSLVGFTYIQLWGLQ
jgi:hypothetical protein